MKSVLFRSYGDKEYGLGHFYRSSSLSAYLSQKNIKAYFAIGPDDSADFINLIRKNKFSVLSFEEIRNQKFDYLVYDMPYYDEHFFQSIRHLSFERKLGLDYFHYQFSDIDIALNLFNHTTPPANLKFSVEQDINFAILRDTILNQKRGAPVNHGDRTKFIITFGSADPCNNTSVILKCLPDEPTSTGTIIEGPLFKFSEEISSLVSGMKYTNVRVFRDVSNLEEHMISGDVIFCGGGTTLLEAIFLARPAFVLPQTTAEKSFATFLESKGLCKVLSLKPDNSLMLNEAFNYESRNNLVNNCLRLEFGTGKELIYQRLING